MEHIEIYLQLAVLGLTCILIILRLLSDRKIGVINELVTMLKIEREKNAVKSETIKNLHFKLDEAGKHYKQLINEYKKMEGEFRAYKKLKGDN